MKLAVIALVGLAVAQANAFIGPFASGGGGKGGGGGSGYGAPQQQSSGYGAPPQQTGGYGAPAPPPQTGG